MSKIRPNKQENGQNLTKNPENNTEILNRRLSTVDFRPPTFVLSTYVENIPKFS